VLLEMIATLCAGVFSGAAIYVNLVEHPARQASLRSSFCWSISVGCSERGTWSIPEADPGYRRRTIARAGAPSCPRTFMGKTIRS
jgi:hypothetical protein